MTEPDCVMAIPVFSISLISSYSPVTLIIYLSFFSSISPAEMDMFARLIFSTTERMGSL